MTVRQAPDQKTLPCLCGGKWVLTWHLLDQAWLAQHVRAGASDSDYEIAFDDYAEFVPQIGTASEAIHRMERSQEKVLA